MFRRPCGPQRCQSGHIARAAFTNCGHGISLCRHWSLVSYVTFSSLSLEPALITFSPARTSGTWPLLREAGRFTVNILPAEHQHLAAQFARSGTDKFAGVNHSPSPLGNPVLEKSLAGVDCELHQEYDGGDHTIVVGSVRALSARADAEPLLFYKGSYLGVRSRAGALESVA